ncbi:SDR family NAD(P)-dependent oxidoreductase [Nocardia jejuensis]|uniref:SDR family NAD(P)-dependent oxidoreductase n=1 Tax=Nocardia jejuensis TaxID=328049 RepID=UPI000833E759|nr:SDR family NAD(P)-dependent oxidoreductase [Nocardia jejuensis]
MPHLAVFGAGPALGFASAQRFGRAGYSVTLIGRHRATVDELHDKLAADGVSADVLLADLADADQVGVALRELHARHGTPDAILYSPGDVTRLPVDAASLDAETLRSWLPLHLLTPVQLLHELLPAMTERGSGAVVFAHGAAAANPLDVLASVGIPQAALVHHLKGLDARARARGVRLSSLQIGSLIEDSAAAALFDSGHFDGVDVGEVVRVAPEVLAEAVFELATTDTAVERVA